MNQSYRSDLTDEQWEVIKTLIPPAKNGGRPRNGQLEVLRQPQNSRPPVDMRERRIVRRI